MSNFVDSIDSLIAVFFTYVRDQYLINILVVRFFVATAERKKRAAAVSRSYPTTPTLLATAYRGSNYYYYFCSDGWSASWSDFACRHMGFQ